MREWFLRGGRRSNVGPQSNLFDGQPWSWLHDCSSCLGSEYFSTTNEYQLETPIHTVVSISSNASPHIPYFRRSTVYTSCEPPELCHCHWFCFFDCHLLSEQSQLFDVYMSFFTWWAKIYQCVPTFSRGWQRIAGRSRTTHRKSI